MMLVLLGCNVFPCGGRCGRASLPPAPTYGMQSSNEGTWLPARHCLVLSCSNERWRFTRSICNSRAWIFMEVLDCLDTSVIEFYIEHIAFY
jgi:hypothetical protein